jgi:class 3 adenylate cyclase/tetratricopeptide (TPR) repeat protein
LICARCEHGNRPGRRFCAECGASLPSECPSCGFENQLDERFCGGCGAALATSALPTPPQADSPRSYTPPHLADKILTSASALTGERKQVTVHFVDISGFTSLSERLDPEAVHATMAETFDLLLEAVHRYEGTVNQFLGDGIMALFGAPIAHEDHAQRAVHAALAIRESLAAYQAELERSRGIRFQVRQGLNTGLVVVGSIGSDLRMDYTAVGDTTNVAARLQQAAQPGHVVVSESAQRLIADHFETRPLGDLALKGKSEPVPAWEVVSRRALRSRVEIATHRGLTPLAGRDAEMRHLLARFEEANQGQGRIVLLSGEPGIGKSRLLHELRQRLGDEVTWMEGRCVSVGRSMAFHPLIDLVKRFFGLELGAENSAADRIERGLRNLVGNGRDGEAADTAPYLCSLVSVDSGNPEVDRMDPQTRRGETLAALRGLIERAAKARPVVLVIEDLHWSDTATEAFLAGIADRLAGQRVLAIFTSRPGTEHRLGGRAETSALALEPLSQGDSAAMTEALLATPGILDTFRALVETRAEGNPFYIEELVRTLEESRADRADDTAPIDIPDTVRDLIAARIDRLAEGPKHLLQVASAIGREFSYRLLSALDASADDHLRALEASALVRPGIGRRDGAYAFNHALTQDVAYGSLLATRRREIHRAVAEAIEELHPDPLAEHTAALAHHYTEAEHWEKALPHLLATAKNAERAYGLREALVLYDQALAAFNQLGDAAPPGTHTQIHAARCNLFFGIGAYSDSRDEAAALLAEARDTGNVVLEASALALGAQSAIWMEDFDEGLAAAAESIALAEKASFPLAKGGGLLITGTVHAITARHDEAEDELSRARELMAEAGDTDREGHALFMLGNLRNWHGRYADGLAQAQVGIAAAREKRLVIPLVRCLWVEGVSRVGLGDYQGAFDTLHESLVLAEKSGDEAYLARILNTLGWLHIDCHDFEPGIAHSERGLDVADHASDATGPERRAFTLINEGDAFLAQHDLVLAAEKLDEAHHIVRHPPRSKWMTWRYSIHCYTSLGELALRRGDPARASSFADESLEIATPTHSRKYQSIAWRLKGRCALMRRSWDDAEEGFARALAFATEIGEPRQLWLSHAAIGTLRAARGRTEDAIATVRTAGEILERTRSQVLDPGLAKGLERAQAELSADR